MHTSDQDVPATMWPAMGDGDAMGFSLHEEGNTGPKRERMFPVGKAHEARDGQWAGNACGARQEPRGFLMEARMGGLWTVETTLLSVSGALPIQATGRPVYCAWRSSW